LNSNESNTPQELLISNIQDKISTVECHLKESKWRLGDELSNDIVFTKFKEKTAEGLSQLCSRWEDKVPKNFQARIEKINKKLKFANETLEFLKHASQDIDPRIEKMVAKLKKLETFNADTSNEEREKILKKIEQYSRQIQYFPRSSNVSTQEEINKAQMLLRTIKSKLSQIKPQLKTYSDTNFPI
jgi:uncharacterized coiled-coil protein SlyX